MAALLEEGGEWHEVPRRHGGRLRRPPEMLVPEGNGVKAASGCRGVHEISPQSSPPRGRKLPSMALTPGKRKTSCNPSNVVDKHSGLQKPCARKRARQRDRGAGADECPTKVAANEGPFAKMAVCDTNIPELDMRGVFSDVCESSGRGDGPEAGVAGGCGDSIAVHGLQLKSHEREDDRVRAVQHSDRARQVVSSMADVVHQPNLTIQALQSVIDRVHKMRGQQQKRAKAELLHAMGAVHLRQLVREATLTPRRCQWVDEQSHVFVAKYESETADRERVRVQMQDTLAAIDAQENEYVQKLLKDEMLAGMHLQHTALLKKFVMGVTMTDNVIETVRVFHEKNPDFVQQKSSEHLALFEHEIDTARADVTTLVSYIQHQHQYARSGAKSDGTYSRPYVTDVSLALLLQEPSMQNVSRFVNGSKVTVERKMKFAHCVSKQGELVRRVQDVMAIERAEVRRTKGTRGYSAHTLQVAVRVKEKAHLSGQQTATVLHEAQSLFTNRVQATPGSKFVRRSEKIMGSVLLGLQSDRMANSIEYGMGIDGAMLTDKGDRKPGMVTRVYGFHDRCKDLGWLASVATEHEALKVKQAHTKAETQQMQRLTLQLLIKGCPLNVPVGAVLATHGVGDGRAYADALASAAASLKIDVRLVKSVLGDFAPVITTGASILGSRNSVEIERVSEFYHGLAKAARDGHRSAWGDGNMDGESRIERYWRSTVRLVRARWDIFQTVYSAVQRETGATVMAADMLVELAHALDAVIDTLNRPGTFTVTRYFGFMRSVSTYFESAKQVHVFMQTVTRLTSQDARHADAWAAVRNGFADPDTQLALVIDAHVYKVVIKDAHLRGLEYGGWITPMVDRYVGDVRAQFADLQNIVRTSMAGSGFGGAERMSIDKQLEKCELYGIAAVKYMSKVFAFLQEGRAQFMAIADFGDVEHGRRALRMHYAKFRANPQHDVLGIFADLQEVEGILSGAVRSVYDTTTMRAALIPVAFGSMKLTTQELEGDVGWMQKIRRGTCLSIEDQSEILRLQRDAASPEPFLDASVSTVQIEKALRLSRVEARNLCRQMNGGHGLTRDISMFFRRAAANWRQPGDYRTSVMLAVNGSVEYDTFREAVLAPSSRAAVQQYMMKHEPPTPEHCQAIVTEASTERSPMSDFVSARRWRNQIPEAHTALKFMVGPAIKAWSLERLHVTPGALCLLQSNLVVGGDVDGFVWEHGQEDGPVQGIAMHIFRHSSNFKDLDARTLSKANHLMACAGVATAFVLEMHVKARVQETILKAEAEGRSVDYQTHVAAGNITSKVTVVSYKPILWASVEKMFAEYVEQYMKPVLAAGMQEWVEPPVCTQTILGKLMSHNVVEQRGASESAVGETTGHPPSDAGNLESRAGADSGQSRNENSGNSHMVGQVDQVGLESVGGTSGHDDDSTDDETHPGDIELEPTDVEVPGAVVNHFWDFEADRPGISDFGVHDIQLEWQEDGNDRKLSRSGLMIGTTMIRMLDGDLPKGMLVHGMAGSGKTAVTMRLVPEIMKQRGYDRDRVAIVTPTNTTANTATNACTEVAPEVFTSNKWLAMDLGEDSVETIIANFDKGGAKYQEAAKRSRRAHVLIWEEFAMQKEEYLRKYDQVLRYLRQCDEPFGGLLIVSLCEVVQLGPVPNSDSARGRSAADRSVDYERLFFYNFSYEALDGTQAVGSTCFLPNMIEVHEQYRMKDPDLLTVALQMQLGGDGIQPGGAKSIRSRLLQNGATIGKHAFAALPTHQAVRKCNDGKYDEIRRRNPSAPEEKYKIVAYGVTWRETGRTVVYLDQMQQGAATEQLDNCISRLENIRDPRLSERAMYALTKKMEVAEVCSGEMITVHAGDVVECIGFDDSNVDLGINDVNVANTSVYPLMRDASGREFRMRPHSMRVGVDQKLGDLHVSHLPLRFAWAGTVHVTQGVTIRSPNQLVIDLANLFAHGPPAVLHAHTTILVCVWGVYRSVIKCMPRRSRVRCLDPSGAVVPASHSGI